MSGPKTHSEMAEVHHVLSQRDNAILCDKGKQINPDDASGAALESILNDIALRRTRTGDADQWELKKSAWQEYDPAFHRIGTRAHQSASEQRPKQPLDKSSPYAPNPPKAHDSFKRIRKDLTADAVVLAMTYRVLHAYCYEKSSPESKIKFPGVRCFCDIIYTPLCSICSIISPIFHLSAGHDVRKRSEERSIGGQSSSYPDTRCFHVGRQHLRGWN